MLVDCFTFFNELDLLEIRLNELIDIVDYFVICESNYTHSGLPKKLYKKEIQELIDTYGDLSHKVKYIIYDGIPCVENAWVNEIAQRNKMKEALSELGLSDDDLIIISDIDELPNPSVLNNINLAGLNGIYALQMDFCYYYLNACFGTKWVHPRIFRYGTLSNTTLNNIRMGSFDGIIPNAGTHFSYLGGIKRIQEKLKAFAHQEYNNETYANDETIISRILNNEDLFGRGDTLNIYNIHNAPYYIPNYVYKNIDKFTHLIKS